MNNRNTIKLRRARDGEEKEVFVGLNGEFFRIQRGVAVEVPAGVEEILEHAEQAEEALDAFLASSKGKACP